MAEPSRVSHGAEPHVVRMLEPRSIAVVGASERPGSFGLRLATEVLRSPAQPRTHLINPSRSTILGQPCLPSLSDLDDAVDLVLLGVPDSQVVEQLELAADRGDGGAVVFGSAHGISAGVASAAGKMAVCGGGCMGFVNVARGIRAIGYLERSPLNAGSIALVTHSGSVFSALLRTHRRLEYSLAVSSGQELVTTTADYLAYALQLPETRVIGLFLETLRDVPRLRECLSEAATRDIPVVALTVGESSTGRLLVEAHSGALAGADAAWEALCATYGVHRVRGLDEMVDVLEAFSIGRRVVSRANMGIATAHDSGAERVHVADVAQRVGVPFAELSESTLLRLQALIDPGLVASNPLDVWGTGAATAQLFAECLLALADDDAVALTALAVDLVPEYDGDLAYPEAIEAILDRTSKPVVVLANLAASVDQSAANRLRLLGVPVLEGTWSGLRALRHLLSTRPPVDDWAPAVDRARAVRLRAALGSTAVAPSAALNLLVDYGISVVATRPAHSEDESLAAALAIGYPVVLKSDDPSLAHKAAAGGVVLDISDPATLRAAYQDLTQRLGDRVIVQSMITPGPEWYAGLLRDPMVGPIVLLGLGGTAVEKVAVREMILGPLTIEAAQAMVARLADRVAMPMTDERRSALTGVVLAVAQIAAELGDELAALDINPLIEGPEGLLAVDAYISTL